jgi:hypothetical protein
LNLTSFLWIPLMVSALFCILEGRSQPVPDFQTIATIVSFSRGNYKHYHG